MSTSAVPPVPILIDGAPYTVPPDQLDQAIRAGAVVETPEQQLARQQRKEAAQGSSIPAAIAGAAESLPFVGGAVSKALEPDAAKRQMQAETHPIAHALGTVGGLGAQAAGMILSGGTEAAAEGAGLIGDAAEMSMLGRTATRALVGAGEGSIYGAGNAVNQAVLGNHPLTAEMLLSGAGDGALLGGVLAGGFSLGGEALGGAVEKVGNSARAKTLGNIVDEDLNSLREAGLGQREINRAFKEGLIEPTDTPLSVQSKLSARLGQVQQDLGELGQKIDSSGQTVNLRNLIVKAGTETGAPDWANLIQPGDDAASFGRLAQVRQQLAKQTSKAARGLMLDLDDAILSKAGNISAEVGEQARGILNDSREFYGPLANAADAAVAAGHVPKGANAMDALLRNGSHFAMWGTVAKMANGHLAAPFVGLSAANFLRRVVQNPEAIAATFLKGITGVAKATGTSAESLEGAVAAALKGSARATAPAASGLTLAHNATDADVERLRAKLDAAARQTVAGNPYVARQQQTMRAVLASALPPPAAHPYLPASLQRKQLGPHPKGIIRYNQTLRAITNPAAVIADLGRGRASKMETDTLHAVYPEITMRAGKMLLNASADDGKTASAQLRRAIETLTGVPFDPALDPAKIARIQAGAFAPQEPPAKAQPQGGAMKLNQKGLASLDLGERTSRGMSGELDGGGK